jgi:DNA-binding transcriptional MerR regulator
MTGDRTAHYPIRAVARMTGLSVDTLRAWERRYDAVVPVRDDRGRVYADSHVQRLKQLAALVEQGHAIGRIAGLSDASLTKLQQQAVPSPPPARGRQGADLAPVLDAMKRYDLPTIESILNRYAVVLPADELIFAVVLPVLREVGHRWESGSARPAHEHLVSAVVRSVLGGLLRTMPRRTKGPRLMFATPSGERHELGLLCGAVLAAAAGADVIYLGPDLPATDIVHAATAGSADVVVIAATAAGAIAEQEFRGLQKLPKNVSVWIGGPAAAPLRDSLGARARAVASLDELPRLIDRHVA